MKMSETVDRATVQRPEMLTISQLARRGVLPERAIRRLVAERKIPVVRSGRTQYINYTLLSEQLRSGDGKLWG
jgi:excisionase family DNA binding protein